jgi:hypothetical protein
MVSIVKLQFTGKKKISLLVFMNEIRIYTYLLLQEILFPDGYDFVNFKKAVKEYEVWKTVNS